jgi:hypothetical protein
MIKMTELFTNVPETVKERARNFVDMTLLNSDPFDIVNILNEYTESCQNEEEQKFVRFYINLRLEEMKNASFSPKW